MPARKIRGVWYVDVWIDVPENGRRRYRRRSPFQTKRETELFEKELLEAVLSTSMLSEIAHERAKADKRFADFAVAFLKTYAAANNKYSEVVTKESILRVHLIPAVGALRLREIGPAVIERYKADKLMTGLSPKTINNHLAVLRKALVVAAEWGLLDVAPRIKQMKVAPPSFDFLDHDEADRLVAAADEPWRTMIITACKTGLRLGEMRALRWEDVDLRARRLMVRRSVSRGKIGTPKSNRTREVPLCDEATAALRDLRHLRGELVFCADDGRMFTRSETYGGLHRACRLAGLRKIGWHCARHTFASHLTMAGVPLKAIQELLGHATIDMTLRYSHLSPEVRREAVGVLDRASPRSGHSPYAPTAQVGGDGSRTSGGSGAGGFTRHGGFGANEGNLGLIP